MKYVLIEIAKFILNIIYFFMKLFPTKDKIVMISRQTNSPSDDFKLLESEIKSHKKYEVVILCKKLVGKEEANAKELFLYFFHMLKQMRHIATSKLVILDSYCICISILKHKKNLKVLQMWHSVGTMKKFGYDILDQDEGNSSKMAKVLRMHKGYDAILCAGEGYRHDLARQFDYPEDYIKIIPLPRMDLLADKKRVNSIKDKIYNKYPELKKKKNIVYVPTFRKNETEFEKYTNILCDLIDYDKYNFILKAHPLSNITVNNKNVLFDKDFSSIEMIHIADYVITDYSCILYEAGFLNKPLYFYAFDYDSYNKNRSLNVDYFKDLPGTVTKDAKEIVKAIEKDNYDYNELNKFIKKYIDYNGNSCKKIYKLIEDLID
jgi:CDP-ribitol ribitolphosphotransferase